MFCTYAHCRVDTGAVFYIGKGSVKDARHAKLRGRNIVWQRVAEKHGVRVEVLCYWPTEAEAFDHERLLISVFRGLGTPLANLTDGGDGVSGWKASAETRKKLSDVQRGKKRSPEAVQKTADALRGRKRPPEVVARVVQANAGYTHDNEARARIKEARAKQVLTSEHKAKIAAALKGRQKTPEHIEKARAAYLEAAVNINRTAAAHKAWETKRRKAREAQHA